MSTIVVGEGVSGLISAIYIKKHDCNHEVVIISNGEPSNSKIAGQRYRTRWNLYTEFDWVNQYYSEIDDPRLPRDFYCKGLSVINDLFHHNKINNKSILHTDQPSWFGPQIGDVNSKGQGKGGSVISWLKNYASKLGVKFYPGCVKHMEWNGSELKFIFVAKGEKTFKLSANYYIISTGSPSGSLFNSTNVPNSNTLFFDLVDHGVKTQDEEIFMLHMAGKCTVSGKPKFGCYETDLLEGYKVYLKSKNNEFDHYNDFITTCLKTHSAHNHFHEICQTILKSGGIAKYRKGEHEFYAKVMHHYSHLSLRTSNGVKISGLNNVYGTGDVVGMKYWLGSKTRLPGTALMQCLVSGLKSSEEIIYSNKGAKNCRISNTIAEHQYDINKDPNPHLKHINDLGLYSFILKSSTDCGDWVKKLELVADEKKYSNLSKIVANKCIRTLKKPLNKRPEYIQGAIN